MKAIYLDTGVLGIVTHPKAGPESKECVKWLLAILEAGNKVCVPEICDYELRREYNLNSSVNALKNLENLNSQVDYVPIDTKMIRRAAELWAQARRDGNSTADPKELDADVILVAQALLSPKEEIGDRIVATTNVGHLSRFIKADTWRNIQPA